MNFVQRRKPLETLEIVLLSLGVGLIVITLVMALATPTPTTFQIWVFRVNMALGAACIGALIPGFIELSGTIGEIAIRAGGAIALFLVVYLINPPASVVDL